MIDEVLVSLREADTSVGVYRDDGYLWLGDLDGPGATMVEAHRPIMWGVSRDRTAQGGRLPEGAVSARVIDDWGEAHEAVCGGGAWVVVLPQGVEGRVNPVCFLDERGEYVASALPEEWRREPVVDATEPCPACGAKEWEEVHQPVDLPELPGKSQPVVPDGMEWDSEATSPFPRCRRCGHEESPGSWISVEESPELDAEAVAEATRQFHEARREESLSRLARIDFPLYRIQGLPAKLSGWGEGSAGIDSASISVGDASSPEAWISIDRGDSIWREDRDAAIEALPTPGNREQGDWPDISRPALCIWLESVQREERKLRLNALKRVISSDVLIELDGSPHPFLCLKIEGSWALAGRVAASQVVVSGTDGMPEDLTLETVEELESLA